MLTCSSCKFFFNDSAFFCAVNPSYCTPCSTPCKDFESLRTTDSYESQYHYEEGNDVSTTCPNDEPLLEEQDFDRVGEYMLFFLG
ncbi:hypothetical protein [Iningainema tapete]|uniref:Uncharacterized protein n=1 Tax=Iningainema tapete BLCC-T55 TaxID=2748662 RepID=A0A8J6XXH1_9CYAN|nr:hypothetical protein [Iningainema tapete]MBD2778222.1 hypothetical protein [Iningainema tapete BLCC-T55]